MKNRNKTRLSLFIIILFILPLVANINYLPVSASTPILESWLAANSAGATASSLDLTKPSGVVTGDLLVIMAGSDDATAVAQFTMADGSWTKDGEAGTSVADAHIAMFWKISTGDETATQTVSHSVAVDELYGWYLRISGTHASTPLHASDYTGEIASASSFDITGITTTVDECRVFYALAFDGGDGSPFSIAGTGWAEIDEENSGTAGTDACGVFGSKDMGATQGETGTATVGSSVTDGASYFQFAVAPPAGADTENPVITLPDHTPDSPKETDDVKLDCTITDNVDVTNAYALHRVNAGGWNNNSMTEGTLDNWYYQSGTYSIGDDVDYYFQARDLAYNWHTLDNSGSYYNFVVTDQTAPVITVPDHNPDAPTETDQITFDCTITDNVDVISAFAFYSVDGGAFNNETMSEGASDLWSFTTAITFNIGELIEYWFKARDAVHNWQTLDNSGSYYSFYITDQDDPVISSPATDPVTPVKETDDVKISATITDNDDVVYAYCLIRINLGGWNNYSMTEGVSDNWYYQSGTYSVGDDVDWYIQAKDNAPNSVVSSTYGFNVTDQTLPVISNPEHSPSTPKETDSLILSATITDNDDVVYDTSGNYAVDLVWITVQEASDGPIIHSVIPGLNITIEKGSETAIIANVTTVYTMNDVSIWYKINADGIWHNISLTYDSETEFYILDFTSGANEGDIIFHYIKAIDNQTSWSVSQDWQFNVILPEETNDPWVHDPNTDKPNTDWSEILNMAIIIVFGSIALFGVFVYLLSDYARKIK